MPAVDSSGGTTTAEQLPELDSDTDHLSNDGSSIAAVEGVSLNSSHAAARAAQGGMSPSTPTTQASDTAYARRGHRASSVTSVASRGAAGSPPVVPEGASVVSAG